MGVPFAGVALPAMQSIWRVAWSRTNVSSGDPCTGGVCMDRWADTYTLQYTQVAAPGVDTPNTGDATTGWQTIGRVTYGTGDGALSQPWQRHEFHVDAGGNAIDATGFRIVLTQLGADLNVAIAELELFAPQIPCPVDINPVLAPDGSFNALNCQITPAGELRFGGVFTNKGTPDNAVLTNNGAVDRIGPGATWVNEAGATIENNASWSPLGTSMLMNNAGMLNNNAGGNVNSVLLNNTGTINNAGFWLNQLSGGHVNSGELFNRAGGEIRIPAMTNSPGGRVDNAGMFTLRPGGIPLGSSMNQGDMVNSGVFLSDLNLAAADVLFDNDPSGTFTNVSGGQATFRGGVENRGLITNEAGGTMTHELGNGGNFTILGGGRLVNAGAFNGGGFSLVASGAGATIANSGTFTFTFMAGAVSLIQDAATLDNLPGGTLVFDSSLRFLSPSASSMLNNAGTINVPGTGGRLQMDGGHILNNMSTGTINVATVNGALILGGPVNNAGVINAFDGARIRVDDIFTNQPGGTINIVDPASSLSLNALTASIHNAGTVNVAGVLSGSLTFGQYVQTAGETNVDALLLAGLIDFQGGTLRGGGELRSGGPVSNSGATVAPGASTGKLTVTGDYVQGPNGTYAAEIGGLVQGVDYDWLAVTGTADLAGTLSLTTIKGFVPLAGQAYVVLTAAEVNGVFDEITVNGFPADLLVNVVYGATAVTVQVVEPSAGDCVIDGSIDLFDFQSFHGCLTGPGGGPLDVSCRCADFDDDDDVDAADFGAFQASFSGLGE